MEKGQRVRPSAEAIERGIFRRNLNRLGTVHSGPRAKFTWVLWDGLRLPQRIHPSFLVPVEEETP